jgi:molybdopterin synthase catalytic subunit
MNAAPTIRVELLSGPLSLPTSAAESTVPQGGADCVFVGRTRPEHHPDHGDLIALDYDCYDSLALRMLQCLAEEACDRWGCQQVRLQHAKGHVPVRAASVLVAVVTDHRAEAFEACRWLIDSIKQCVPIWKREVWTDGTTWVKGHPVTRETEVAS